MGGGIQEGFLEEEVSKLRQDQMKRREAGRGEVQVQDYRGSINCKGRCGKKIRKNFASLGV